jgi:hypothetical protein
MTERSPVTADSGDLMIAAVRFFTNSGISDQGFAAT